jgi:hypothetical protein
MFIVTGEQIINCDNTIRIYSVSDDGKYKVLAHPGGVIMTVDTKNEALNCIDIIANALRRSHIDNAQYKILSTAEIIGMLKARCRR